MSTDRRHLTAEQYQRLIQVTTDLAREGRTSDLGEFLDLGTPVETADEQDNTLLMLAAYHGHADTVRDLLRRGASPDTLNARGQSPLAGALFKREPEVVRALVEAGADPDLGTPTARQAAEMFGSSDLLESEPRQ